MGNTKQVPSKTSLQKAAAVDEQAKAYWTEYYKDSDYGQLWVRDIPMRIKAAFALTSKIAASDEPTPIIVGLKAVASVIHADGVTLDGVATWSTGRKAGFAIDFT